MRGLDATLGPAQIAMILQWGRRRKGTSVPQVVEHFDISHLAAWRAVQRLVKRGKLFKIGRKRRREMLFGSDKAGRGADVYRTRPEAFMEHDDGGKR